MIHSGRNMADPQLDPLLDALGPEAEDKLLAELLGPDPAAVQPRATGPKEIRARLKTLAGQRPELIAKIIDYWMREERRRP